MKPKTIYLIGSLRNPEVPKLAQWLRDYGFDVFDDWYAAGPEADDYWRKYEIDRGHDQVEALHGLAAEHVHSYDDFHLNRADLGILMLPAGRSGHLELGQVMGAGKRGYILLDEDYDRWDVMYRKAIQSGGGVFWNRHRERMLDHIVANTPKYAEA